MRCLDLSCLYVLRREETKSQNLPLTFAHANKRECGFLRRSSNVWIPRKTYKLSVGVVASAWSLSVKPH